MFGLKRSRNAFARVAAGVLMSTVVGSGAWAGSDFDQVKKAGVVRCGMSMKSLGFSYFDEKGVPKGFDVDFCRAIASAVFGSPDKVKLVTTTTQTRFVALQTNEVDVQFQTIAMTLLRDTTLGLSNVATTLNNGVGIMVSKDLNVDSALKLDGATLCILQGTSMERAVLDFAKVNKLNIKLQQYDSSETERAALFSGRCDGMIDDMLNLQRNKVSAPAPERLIVLPEIVAKETDGMMVRSGDPEWEKLVRWTFFALIQAEEFGLDSKNVDQVRSTTTSPEIRRFLGLDGNIGKAFGLKDTFVYDIIKNVGNYGEVFERNLGKQGGIGSDRGLNRLWTQGGLMISQMWQ